MAEIIELTDENFKSEIAKDEPIMVDFWAPWCGPCKALNPAIKEFAALYAGRLRVGKLNIDESEVVAEKYSINSIPALMIFKDGKLQGSAMGTTKSEIRSWIDGVIGK